jgi:hypothetical protein
VIVPEVIVTLTLTVIDVVFRLSCWPDVPTVPWTIVVPPEVVIRKNVAVPVADAATVIGVPFNVMTPLDAEPNAVELRVKSARRVFPERAVSAVAGSVPE